jgi:two-component system, LytTR family, sensor kinase
MNRLLLLQRPWARWLLIFGLLTLVALFEASQSFMLLHFFVQRRTPPPGPPPPPMSLGTILTISLVEWYVWAALAPLLIFAARRFAFEPTRWRTSLALLLGLTAVVALGKVAIDVPVELSLRTNWGSLKIETPGDVFMIFFAARFLIYFLICWAILGVSQAIEYYLKYRQREMQTLQLQARLAQAQLQVLKIQLHPHFLFNTLNTISALMHQDVELADRMLTRLADLLRLTLDNAGLQEVPLQQELEFIQPYLEIEQARLGARLQVQMEIDPETRDATVPNLVLQPLVENAIRHGIAPRPEGGRLAIRTRRTPGKVQLEVADDGPGLPNPEDGVPCREGFGLKNTRARLEQLYGPSHQFTLSSGNPGGGLVVTLAIPFHESGHEEGDA